MKSPRQSSNTETVETTSDFATDDLLHTLDRVRHGITEDARVFLRRCALYLELGEPVPIWYSLYLAERFNEMALAKEPFKAKLLKRRKGHKGSDQLDRDFAVASEVWREVKKGASVVSAAQKVQDRTITKGTGLVLATKAEDLYYKYRSILDREDRDSDVAKAALRRGERTPTSPDIQEMMSADAGKGFENVEIEDMLCTTCLRKWLAKKSSSR